MYIFIDSSKKSIPKISFKKTSDSNVIKKNEFVHYIKAKELLDLVESQIPQYQSVLEEQVLKLLHDKEQEINDYLSEVAGEHDISFKEEKKHWFDEAQKELNIHMAKQAEELKLIKNQIKKNILMSVENQLNKFTQSPALIAHLMEVLHAEINDYDKKLEVHTEHLDDDVILTIENDDRSVTVHSKTVIDQLKGILGKL